MSKNKNNVTVKQQVKTLLNKKWVDYIDVYESVEGDGMRRLRELRSEGVNVVKKYNPKTQTFQYRIAKVK